MLPEQIAISVALTCFTVVLLLSFVMPTRHSLSLTGLMVAAMALLTGIVLRWDRIGQGPFLTMFEVLLSNLFSLSLVYTVLYWRIVRLRPTLPIVITLLMILAAWALLSRPDTVLLPPTFNHPWLWLHVIAGKLFLSFCMSASSMAILLLLNQSYGIAAASVSTHDHDPIVWKLMAIAFVFHSFMLIAGAVWAHDAWGRYWSWDPLETWSLLTWLSLAVVLHLRLTFRLPPALGWLLVIGVFAVAFLTFFGVPFVSTAPHKGAM